MLRKPTQLLIAGSLSLVVAVASAMPGVAQLRDEYTLRQAESGAVSIQVWQGSGTNLDFTRTGEYIYRAWLDDPSRVQFDTDTPIENANAQIIHLRKIEGIDFDGLPSTGVTLLSVATVNAAGQRSLYQFRVSYGGDRPEYATIALVPQSEPVGINTIPVNAAYGGVDLETFRAGITQLILDGTIEGDGPMHGRLKTFIGLVQDGSTLAEAAQVAGLNQAVIAEVAQIGAQVAAAETRSRFESPLSDEDLAPLEEPGSVEEPGPEPGAIEINRLEPTAERLAETLRLMNTIIPGESP